MHIIWENLTATLLMLSIAFVLVTVNARNHATLNESTAYYALKSQGIAFAEVLKRDLQGVEEVLDHAESDSSFSFRTHIGESTTSFLIEYRRRHVSTRYVEQMVGGQAMQVPIKLYEIQRFVDGTRYGGSMSSLTKWEIQALNEEDDPLEATDDLSNCRKIWVRFEAATPFHIQAGEETIETETVDRMRWESTFVPPLRSRSAVI